ncbi:hypothetical protein IJ596_01515 [bacterium]|nr:hypothetical protein [bacterium]
MQIYNLQNYNYNQKPAFGSTIVPNETIEKLFKVADKRTFDDKYGLGEDYKNLLVSLRGIIDDGRDDVIEIGEDKNGIAFLTVNGKKSPHLNGISNYSYYRSKDGKFSDKFDGHGSYEQILDFAQREKGVELPYKRYEKSPIILDEDEVFVCNELNKLRALSPTHGMFFIDVKNLIFNMKWNIRDQLRKDLKELKNRIFNPSETFNIKEKDIQQEQALAEKQQQRLEYWKSKLKEWQKEENNENSK